MRIAIIGSGISGLSAAWLLQPEHEVTVFEKNDYFGGHTDTHAVTVEGQALQVDTGFIVFNEHNYPLLCAMLRELGVAWQESDMSFSVNNLRSGLVYNPSTMTSLLLHAQNFFKPAFRAMLSDLQRFYTQTRDMAVDQIPTDITIAEFLDQHSYSEAFRLEHLYPMCGALWSAEGGEIADLPLKFVLGFFQNHRMLQVSDRPQWLTVKGGSARYVDALKQQMRVHWADGVTGVSRTPDGVLIQTQQQTLSFDQVIFACHADQALALLQDPSDDERRVLTAFRYRPNLMVLHTDSSVMPKARSNWASWQVRVAGQRHPTYSFTYWMNTLQRLPVKTPVLATLNPNTVIDPAQTLVTRHYEHPVFDVAALNAQGEWHTINGINQSYFCGAYWGWGFHEDGVRSAHRVVDHLLAAAAKAAHRTGQSHAHDDHLVQG